MLAGGIWLFDMPPWTGLFPKRHKLVFQAKDMGTCNSLEILLGAVRNGEQLWLAKQCLRPHEGRSINMSLVCETLHSYFHPQGCSISPIVSKDACDILNQYSHVIVGGDSLLRHTAQGLMMI